MLTDAINLILIDTNNEMYINKFTLRMLAPTTQEEVDRRDNLSNKVALVGDIMNSLAEMEDPTIKLKILKTLLSDTLSNPEVIALIQDQIDILEAAAEQEEIPMEDAAMEGEEEDLGDLFSDDSSMDFGGGTEYSDSGEVDNTTSDMTSSEDSILPSPADLGAGDFSDSSNPELT